MKTTPTTSTIHTEETPATGGARGAAFQVLANMSHRQLAEYHRLRAKELVDDLYSSVRDFGDETDPYSASDADQIEDGAQQAIASLKHLIALVQESAANPAQAIAPAEQPHA